MLLQTIGIPDGVLALKTEKSHRHSNRVATMHKETHI